MRYLSIVFLSLFIVGCQTTAMSEPETTASQCPMPDPQREFARWEAHVMTSNPNVKRMVVEDVAAFMRGYNASPPASDIHIDAVYLYKRPGDPFPLVAMVRYGCVMMASQAKPQAVANWLHGKPYLEGGA